ncbi:MAG: Multidrug resistance protein Stp [Acidimicrobiales bacterium]|nr:MAG: MFS transporter [Actinomycetota bacterium]MBV6510083.1 Multidrug resistance protein Stp [Acidimicrobiales bacterium]RIK03577.1 MAG: MFS transporter [Acidobacteriota bacterium]
MKRWWPLLALAVAQFLMVLDQAVMNVSISQLVEDFDTTVTTIQAVITFYSLVMAMLMLTGGKIGDIMGRRRTFVIGLVIYGCGSAVTAAAPNVLVLTLGWSVLEGIGAALVLPALAALIAGNYEGPPRRIAYAVIGGVAGAGIAVGPILGGWATTEVSWRVVFWGEVVLVLAILALAGRVGDAPLEGRPPRLDAVGAVLSAVGIGTIVLGVLQAGAWGWVQPKDSPITPFGFSLTPFVVTAGGVVIWLFARWQHHREAAGRDPLVHLDLLGIPPVRSGLAGLLSQNLILMGIFFTIPLYLQLVLGLDALDTGIKMLPVSVAMLVASALGSRLAARYSARSLIRTGLVVIGVAVLGLLSTIEPELAHRTFALSMALLGVGMGLVASQLGNVIQSSVDSSGRGEAGGLQYTGQQLGSSLGVALIGAIVLAGLTSTFVAQIQDDDRINDEVAAQVSVAAEPGVDFVSTDEVVAALDEAGLEEPTSTAILEDYEDAQLQSLKAGLLAAAVLSLVALAFTRDLPHEPARAGGETAGSEPPETEPPETEPSETEPSETEPSETEPPETEPPETEPPETEPPETEPPELT